MKSIVIAGTRGIGKSIADALAPISAELVVTGRSELDTSDMESVRRFIRSHPATDVLVLNTGGPPPMTLAETTEETWLRSFNQLFLSFALMLRDIRINDNGYVFLISSHLIKEPDPGMVLSSSLRLGFTAVFKAASRTHMSRRVSFINIAPGPTDTARLRALLAAQGKTVEGYASTLPSNRITDPAEIGGFVRFVVENGVGALNGQTLNFDMGLGKSLF